jgi:hypothetical protein
MEKQNVFNIISIVCACVHWRRKCWASTGLKASNPGWQVTKEEKQTGYYIETVFNFSDNKRNSAERTVIVDGGIINLGV